MDLGAQLERLRQLQRERQGRNGPATDVPPPAGGGTLADGPEGALGLVSLATVAGPAFLRESAYPLTHCHGEVALRTAAEVGDAAWVLLGAATAADGQAGGQLARAAFIDVETTGLAGGTGVVAFLVGVARVSDDRVIIRQFFLRDFGEEEALLTAVDAALADVRTIVTYNGKIFDWPLLNTRCIINRARFTAPIDGHVDLLYPSRRIWQYRLPDCRLSTIEEKVLGFRREGDVPGELIPALYFGYQRSGDARPLQPVFTHNQLDLLSLIALFAVVGGALTDPFRSALRCSEDFYGLGRWCLDRGLEEAGVRCLERAGRNCRAAAVRVGILRELALAYKRLRRRQDAAAIWRELIDGGALTLFPYVELAKHHEHVERDYEQALALVQRALDLSLRCGQSDGARDLAQLLRRRDRLQRKLAARSADAGSGQASQRGRQPAEDDPHDRAARDVLGGQQVDRQQIALSLEDAGASEHGPGAEASAGTRRGLDPQLDLALAALPDDGREVALGDQSHARQHPVADADRLHDLPGPRVLDRRSSFKPI